MMGARVPLACLAALLILGGAAYPQPLTTREHPDYARVPKDVAQQLSFPAQPANGQEVYGFQWARVEGYAPERWVFVGGKYTRRLRVDGNKNGKLENDDPIREETFVHYYVATTTAAMGDIDDWQPPQEPFPDRSKFLGPKEKPVPLGDFGYVRFGPGDFTAFCQSNRGPVTVSATVEYRPTVSAFSQNLRNELHQAGINLYEYIDEPAWNQVRDQAQARCPELAKDVVRQMLAKWDPYWREKLLPGNGFKGLYVQMDPYKLTAQDLPPQLTLGTGPRYDEFNVFWKDPVCPERILEHYRYSLQRWEPESYNPLGWALEEARKGFASNCAASKHPYPVDLPGVDQVARSLYRDKGENSDAVSFRYGNVVGTVMAVPPARSVEAPGHWTNRLAQALCLKLQSRAVPRELWEEKPVTPATLAPYRMVYVKNLPVQVEKTEFAYQTGQVKSTSRESQLVGLGWIGVKEGALPLPTKYVTKAEWLGRDFSFTYKWASRGQELTGTAKGTLSADLQRLDKLVMHEVLVVRNEFDPGVWNVEKTERHLELQGTQLLGIGEETMDCFPVKITAYASTHSWDLNPLKKIKLRVDQRVKSVSETPGKDASGVPIVFYR